MRSRKNEFMKKDAKNITSKKPAKNVRSKNHPFPRGIKSPKEKTANIIETIYDGYFEVDLAGNFTFLNDKLCEIHGYSAGELMGMNFRRYSDEENAKKIFKTFNSVFKTGEAGKIFDYEIIRPDGTRRQVEVSASLIKDAKGNYIGFRGITRDVTERKLIEEALRQSEGKYRTILEEMEDAYYEVDIAGNFTFVNDASCRHIGYSREELLGKNFHIHMHQEDKQILYDAFRKIYMTGKPQKNISYRVIHKDGTTAFAELTGFPLYNEKGKVIGFRGIGRDVTRRKLMEEELRQSEERYRTVMDEIEEWYFETDIKGNIIFSNDAFIRYLGHPRARLIGHNLREFIRQEDAEDFYKICNHACDTGETMRNFPQEFAGQHGKITYAEFSILPKRDEAGKIFGLRVVGHDITERKKIEKMLDYKATHDPLTGLPNRALLMDRLEVALAQAKRANNKLAVMLLDLDHFKKINDNMGHMEGDKLLKEIGVRLSALLRQNDTIACIGGDEFVILLPEIRQVDDVIVLADKIINTVKQPLFLAGGRVNSSASMGIVIYPDDCQNIGEMLKNADMAMYRAKSKGRDNYQFFGNIKS